MNFKVQKYSFFPAGVSDLFATVAKVLYQISPGQNILFFKTKRIIFFHDSSNIFWNLASASNSKVFLGLY